MELQKASLCKKSRLFGRPGVGQAFQLTKKTEDLMQPADAIRATELLSGVLGLGLGFQEKRILVVAVARLADCQVLEALKNRIVEGHNLI